MSFLTDLASKIKTWANGRFALSSHDHSTVYEPKNANIQSHISSVGNPHGATKSDIGLGNVTNDAQMKKRSSSINGNIAAWVGTTGDTLGDGYGVETVVVGGSDKIPRADAVKAAIDAISTGIGGAIIAPVADLTALKAINTTNASNYPDKSLINVESLGLYRLDRESSATADDAGVVQPTTGVGRWIRLASPTNDHNLQSNLQGGSTGEYYHITLAIYNALAGTNGTPSGSNKFVTSSDPKLSKLNTDGTYPVNDIAVLAAEWTAFENALNA